MTKIATNLFRSILCLNGDIPQKSFFDQFTVIPVIAADRAGMFLIQMGITPEMVIGDFDSFSGDLYNEGTKFLKYTDQNSTDFEKCIVEMNQKLLFPALVCGAFGKEIDHTINNMHCLMKYGRKCPMVFYDHAIATKSKWCIPIYDQFNFKAIKGELISLLPYPEAVISTKGLKWDLDNILLSVCGLSSARNRVQKLDVKIQVHNGQVMMVIGRLPDNSWDRILNTE
jgi:thiamine pyrophosphokinase